MIGSGPTTLTTPSEVGNTGVKCDCDKPKPAPPSARPAGMPHYAVSAILVSLNIEDQPVGYVPAKGPPVNFTITYNQLESQQPATFSFSNVGAQWTHNWLTYVQDDPANVGSNVTLYMPAGGALTYRNYNASTGTFDPETREQAVLALVSANGLHYERRLADGSVWVYATQDGSTAFPRHFFLSSIIDPQGNAVTLTYDGNLRLTSLTDAQGQSHDLHLRRRQSPADYRRDRSLRPQRDPRLRWLRPGANPDRRHRHAVELHL